MSYTTTFPVLSIIFNAFKNQPTKLYCNARCYKNCIMLIKYAKKNQKHYSHLLNEWTENHYTSAPRDHSTL